MAIRYEPLTEGQYAFVIPGNHPFNLRHPDDIKIPAVFGLDRKFNASYVHNGRWVWVAETKAPKNLANFIDCATEYFNLKREHETVTGTDGQLNSLKREVLVLTNKVKNGPGKEKVPVDTGDIYLGQPVESVKESKLEGDFPIDTVMMAVNKVLDLNDAVIGLKFSAYVISEKGLGRVDVPIATPNKSTMIATTQAITGQPVDM